MYNDDLTDEQYKIADCIEAALEVAARDGLTPSAAGRKARTDTSTALTVLEWMVRHRYAQADGNGAWTRYYARNLTPGRQAGGGRR